MSFRQWDKTHYHLTSPFLAKQLRYEQSQAGMMYVPYWRFLLLRNEYIARVYSKETCNVLHVPDLT
jgi:hypothetical protein